MAYQAADLADSNSRGGDSDRPSVMRRRNQRPAQSAADSWIDEEQWLAGLPSKWGEHGGGWVGRF
jgi:hypothetical protein